MSGISSESESVEELSESVEEHDSGVSEVNADEPEEKTSVQALREDPFASLNMPPPLGVDMDSEDDYSDDEDLRGPSISALDANKKKLPAKDSQLSKKSEDFLASMGIGLDEESEEIEKPSLAPIQSLSLIHI